MGLVPPPWNGDYDKGINCLSCYAPGQTPKYLQAVIWDMAWAEDPEPLDDYELANGVPIVLKQGIDFQGDLTGHPCVWGGGIPAVGPLPWFWTVTYAAAVAGRCFLSLDLEGTSMLGQFPNGATCRISFGNDLVWPVIGGSAVIEANESINEDRYTYQQAGNETTDRASILLKSYNLFDFTGEDFYERWFLYNNRTVVALRNQIRSCNIRVLWDEKEFQE